MIMTLMGLMAFMAHMVVPHHHHKNGMCVELSHSDIDENGCEHRECSSCDHDKCENNNNDSPKEGCKAYDPFLSRVSGGNDDVNKYFSQISLLLPVVVSFVFDDYVFHKENIPSKPPVEDIYLNHIIKSLGFRAPPVVA